MQLCDALEIKHLIGKAGSQTPEDIHEFKQAISDKLKGQSFDYWTDVFAKLDCCVEPVLSFKEASQQPHAQARNWLSDAAALNAEGKCLTQLSNPISKPTQIHNTGGAIGSDTEQVLSEQGFSIEAVTDWKKKKVIR